MHGPLRADLVRIRLGSSLDGQGAVLQQQQSPIDVELLSRRRRTSTMHCLPRHSIRVPAPATPPSALQPHPHASSMCPIAGRAPPLARDTLCADAHWAAPARTDAGPDTRGRPPSGTRRRSRARAATFSTRSAPSATPFRAFSQLCWFARDRLVKRFFLRGFSAQFVQCYRLQCTETSK